MTDNAHDLVVLVDKQDHQIGLMDKLEAHEKGILHRAFSVIVFNSSGEVLLQQRAATKYHSRQLWTNSCCSHPREHEDILQAAHRRLQEEMGFDCNTLYPVTVLHYQTPLLDTGLIENEMLHLFVGITECTNFTPHPDEVMAYRWITPEALQEEIAAYPEKYSFWFRIYLQKFDMHALFQRML